MFQTQKLVIVGPECGDSGITALENLLSERQKTNYYLYVSYSDNFKSYYINFNLYNEKFNFHHSKGNLYYYHPEIFYKNSNVCIILGDNRVGNHEKEYFENQEKKILQYAPNCRFIRVINKCDLVKNLPNRDLSAIQVSCKTEEGIDKLIFAIENKTKETLSKF